MMKKRVLALVLTLTMALPLLACTAAAQSDFVDDGTERVGHYTGPGGDVTLPLHATDLPGNVFWSAVEDGAEIYSITVPGGIQEITGEVFSNLPHLTKLVFQEGVKRLEGPIVNYSRLVTAVYIPASVTEIDSLAFHSVWAYEDYAEVNNPNLVIYGVAGSYAETYAKELGYAFRPGPAPIERPLVAVDRQQDVEINGDASRLDTYVLRDADGNEINYVRVRDVAQRLSGTSAQFNAGWNGAVNLERGKAYEEGAEQRTPYSGPQIYRWNTGATHVDGAPVALDSILITDREGNGYTYYKLRDLGKALGFTVDWSADRGIYVESPGYVQEVPAVH